MDQATLMDKIKTGTTLCKAIMRNGYDAYAINAPLQGLIFEKTGVFDVDIACACDTETLFKIFPNAVPYTEEGAMAMLQENGVTLRFYSTDVEDASHPEMSQLRITPRLARLLAELQLKGQLKSSNTNDPEAKEFEDFDKAGSVKLVGLPSKTLAKNYLLAIRALRYAANFDLPVNPHTWVSIIQSANRILDYVPAREIMEEWRKVAAESMWKFVQLLFEAQLLHGLMPEIAALSCIKQERNDDGDIESVFDHTIECMKRYPEEGFSMDWYGTLATMFHDVGKLYTAEHLNGRWTFYQHHRVGAGVTRKILRRLHFTSEDIDLICHLVRHHMMFHFMLTDRGIRRFKALPETERLIAMCRADIEARDGMATAQYIAGMAFSNVGLGLVHGMAHPLGAYYDIPHGVANALLLPFVMEYNKEAAKAKYRTIAEAMGVDTSSMSDDEAADAAVKAVKDLAIRVRIPQHLSEIGVPESGLPTLAQAAFNDVCTPGNPRQTNVEEILAIYKKAF